MKRAFSLLEMLIVMLIVTIVAAASAPMISKKMLNDAANDSPWIWTNNNSIAFNLKGNDNTPAVIGAMQSPKKAMLYIETPSVPHISFASKNDRTPLNLKYLNGSVSLSTKDTTGKDSVVIGKNAESKFDSSVAIGAGATTTANNQIMLGTSSETVKIPGTLDPNKANFGHLEGEIPFGTANSTLKVQGKLMSESIVDTNGRNIIKAEVETSQDGYTRKVITIGDSNDNYTHVKICGDVLDIENNFRVFGNTYLGEKAGSYVYMNLAKKNGETPWLSRIYRRATLDPTSVVEIDSDNTAVRATFSDRRLKNIGEEFKGGLEEIKKLQVYNYTFKKDKSKMPRVGVIAQDLEKIFPNAVIKGDDGFLRIRMEDIWYSIVNAVKQLDSRITEITNDLKTAVADIIDLKSKVTNQEKLINELVEQNKSQDKIIKDLEKRLAKLEKKDK